MILLSYVIDIVVSDTAPNYPPDQFGNLVFAIECDDSVSVGMYYNESSKTFENIIKEVPLSGSEKILIALNKTHDELKQEGADLMMTEL